jgi:hypothetical protein
MDLNFCIQKLKENVKNEYALEYIASLEDAIDSAGTDGLCIQLLYILENSRTWRGEEAREVKNFIRKWIKEKNG